MEKEYYKNISQEDIIFALQDEEKINKMFCEYSVSSLKTEGIGVYSVTLTEKTEGAHPFSKKIQIDEVMVGGKIWWEVNGTTGYAEIFLVVPENEEVAFRFLNGPLPKENTVVRIYLPNYIEPLITCWKNKEYVHKVKKWLEEIKIKEEIYSDFQIEGSYKSWLRKNQKQSFNLLKLKAGLLWGPPGTGKTTTTGAMIAEYVKKNPYDNVLIVGNTNLAVDTIFTGFDRVLDNFDDREEIRKKTIRFGQYFIPKLYKGREYLLGKKRDKVLLNELFILEQEREKISSNDIKTLAVWQEKYESLKKQLKVSIEEVVSNYSIIAMTSTVALYYFDLLLENKFDLVILEEASQINLCQALMLALLGDRVIFTGDDKQLSPIAQSKTKEAKEYLKESIFKYKNSYLKDRVFFLNEQSRMTGNICRIVSEVFYDGQLCLASFIPKFNKWKEERKLYPEDIFKGKDIDILNAEDKGQWSQRYGGLIRFSSADKIDKICRNLIDHFDSKEEDINILTPFRSQKNFIKSFLRRSQLKKIKVNTIHKSQGSECHTIIFDPVDANSKFLTSEEALHIINVAISRAKARLIICLNESDYNNEVFYKIASLVSEINKDTKFKKYPNIAEYIKAADFPKNTIGKTIDFNKSGILNVIEVDKDKIIACSYNNNKLIKKISLKFILKIYNK